MKQIIKLTCMLIFMVPLVACVNDAVVPIVTAKTVPSLTLSSPRPIIPPSTPVPTGTSIASIPTSSIQAKLRMAYVIGDSLYVQDGSNPPVQLTQGDRDRLPTFSNDGKKIAFFRRFIPHDLYSINSDGSQEQALVSGDFLKALGLGYTELSEIRSFAFVPNSHLLIFNTRELDETDVKMQDWNRSGSKNNDDLLMVDTDTGELRSLLSLRKGGNFFIAPDGKMIAVQSKGHIDVISIKGQVIHQNLVTYIPTQPYELLPDIFWTVDSTELIVTLPVGAEYDMDGPETRSVWRYTIDGKAKVQISLNPPPIGSDYSVSPDGNWILHSYYYYPGKTNENVTPGLYLGNLRDGNTQAYSPDVLTPTWSPDSKHFVYEGLFLGTVDDPPESTGEGNFLGWADSSHYLYFNETIVIAEIGGEKINIPTDVPATSVQYGPDFFSFILLENTVVNK